MAPKIAIDWLSDWDGREEEKEEEEEEEEEISQWTQYAKRCTLFLDSFSDGAGDLIG